MFRKHTRRAAKAAFAISFGVALLIGLTACGGGGGSSDTTATTSSAPKPTITLGTKNFGEEYILGQLYGQALAGEGLPGHLQGQLRLVRARRQGDQEREDELLSRVHGRRRARPREGEEARRSRRMRRTSSRRSSSTTRGLTLLNPTPFADTDTFTMLTSTAKKDGLKTMSDLSKLKSFSYARLSGVPDADHVHPRDEADLRAQEHQVHPDREHQRLHAARPGQGDRRRRLLHRPAAAPDERSTRRSSTTSTSSASRTSRRCSRRACSRGRTGRCSRAPPTRSRRS